MDCTKEQVRTILAKWASEEIGSVEENLYIGYQNSLVEDESAVMDCYHRLDSALKGLKLKDYDKVWDIACALSDASERRGFYAGLRTGVRLMQELYG